MLNVTVQDNYKPILTECFNSDKELLSKWHIVAGEGLTSCVDKTHVDLVNSNITFHTVKDGAHLVGYFGKAEQQGVVCLVGFFIKPEYRHMKQEFWSLVKSEFNGLPFYCGLYEKNIPANKFIRNVGGQIMHNIIVDNNPAVIYKVGA